MTIRFCSSFHGVHVALLWLGSLLVSSSQAAPATQMRTPW